MQPKPSITGLVDLARSNQRARDAALLAATTELFVQDPIHDRDEIHRYEELATHLLPKVAVDDRARVGELLAESGDAPQSVIRMLARDVIDVAAPIIRSTPVLDPLDLLAVIAATGVEHHRLIARRPNLSDQVKRALRLTGDVEVLRHLDAAAARATAADEAARPAATVSPLRYSAANLSHGQREPAYFLGLDRPHRLRMLAAFASRPPAHASGGSAGRLDRAFRSILGAAKIVGYARGGQIEELIGAIADGLDLPPALVKSCLDDSTGEALVVLLKALRLDDVQAQQVFLLVTPAGRDTAAFFPLADLYAGMEPEVAETICELWRSALAGRQAGHQRRFDDGDAARQRREPAATPAEQPAARAAEQPKRA